MSNQTDTSATAQQSIAVGVDGSSANEAAVRWAAQTADRRGLTLDILHVIDEAMRNSPYISITEIRRSSEEVLTRAVEQVAASFPQVSVTTQQMFGHTAHTLREVSADANMLVLGRRGRGSFTRMLLGSVSAAAGNKAEIPTAVIPAGWDSATHPNAPVVVGIDGSQNDDTALRYAVELADELASELRVVHVWGPDGVFPTENALAQGKLEGWRKDAAELLATRVDPWRTKFPHVPISGVLRQDHVVRALVAESQTALALVVGGHDANRAHAFLAASTTSGVLHHAECPILVLPDTR